MNIGIYIYDDAEVLDFSGPFEVFSVASRFLEKDKKFNVFLVSQKKGEVVARGGYSVNTKYDFTNHPKIDTLVVVGGIHTQEMKKQEVISWIKDVSKTASIKASVCTGAFLYAKANVITTHKVTTHWEDIDDLKEEFSSLDVVSNVRWVDLGDIITSAGISAGIDMSLQIVSKLINEDLALKTARQMDFDWRKNK
jgi:transcriptional regulator GlxA family with amidase domain